MPYNPAALAKLERDFEHLGASAEEARKAVWTFTDSGIAPDKLDAFKLSAQNLAEVMGIKLPEAAKQVADAFTQGYAAIAAFDDKQKFLTRDQREHIRTLFDEGKASEARTEALAIFERKEDDVAEKSRGSWAGATRELKSAWYELLDALGESKALKVAAEAVDNLATGARNAVRGIRAATDAGAAAGDLQRRRKELDEFDKAGPPLVLTPGYAANRKAARDGLVREIARLEAHVRELGGDPNGGVDGKALAVKVKPGGDTRTNDPNSVEAKQTADKIEQIRLEDELQRLQDAGGLRALSLAEQRRREQLAGIIAFRQQSDSSVGAAERELAIAHERTKIAKELQTRQTEANRDRSAAIKQYESNVIRAEGGPGKNPYSRAAGYGQFFPKTFVDYYRRSSLDQSLSDSQIVAKRTDKGVASAVIEVEAKSLAAALEKHRLAVSALNLYVLHYLGERTGLAVLNARRDTPINEIIDRVDPNAAKVKSGNAPDLRTENGKGVFRTVGQFLAKVGKRVGAPGDAGDTAETHAIEQQQTEKDRAEKQQRGLNQALADESAERQRLIAGLTAEDGLRDHALLAAQRKAAVDKAEFEVRKKLDDANKTLDANDPNRLAITDEDVKLAREEAAALFDVAHARDSANADIAGPARDVEERKQEVDLLKQQAEYLRSIGDNKSADKIDKQITAVNHTLATAIDTLIAAYSKLTPKQLATLGITDKGLKNILSTLKQSKQATQEWGKIAGVTADNIAHAFASSAANAFTNFLNNVAAGKNVFKSLGESVLEFAANFASAVAQMILQLLAYAAAVAILKALGVPVPAGGGGFAGAFGGGGGGAIGAGSAAGTHHTGGIVGSAVPTKTINPAIFHNAMRFHTGGVIGLSPDEVPIIAKRNEEVLTRDDPRHRANGGMGGGAGGSTNIKIVQVQDHAAALQEALRTKVGEKAFIQALSDNRGAVRAILG